MSDDVGRGGRLARSSYRRASGGPGEGTGSDRGVGGADTTELVQLEQAAVERHTGAETRSRQAGADWAQAGRATGAQAAAPRPFAAGTGLANGRALSSRVRALRHGVGGRRGPRALPPSGGRPSRDPCGRHGAPASCGRVRRVWPTDAGFPSDGGASVDVRPPAACPGRTAHRRVSRQPSPGRDVSRGRSVDTRVARSAQRGRATSEPIDPSGRSARRWSPSSSSQRTAVARPSAASSARCTESWSATARRSSASGR
jgi:hypothetical protein